MSYQEKYEAIKERKRKLDEYIQQEQAFINDACEKLALLNNLDKLYLYKIKVTQNRYIFSTIENSFDIHVEAKDIGLNKGDIITSDIEQIRSIYDVPSEDKDYCPYWLNNIQDKNPVYINIKEFFEITKELKKKK